MTKLAANLTMLYNEVDFLDRFDAGEARLRGRIETVEKVDLVPQHRQVGSELHHCIVLR